MHSTETKNKFIELRAQGLSLSRIADQLTVSKRTLVDWNRQHQADIDSLRALEIEALHEKVLASHEQELTRLAAFQRKLDDELANRPLDALSTDKLLRLSLLVRREIRALCTHSFSPASGSQPSTIDNPPLQSQIKAHQAKPISPAAAESPADPTDHGRLATDPHLSDSQPPVLHSFRSEGGSTVDNQPSQTQIKVNQVEPISPVESRTDEHEILTTDPPSSNPSVTRHSSPVTRPSHHEHCLHCGDPLPPLLPDGARPSPWCACGSPIAAPPGFSIRELCRVCAAPVPVHGYNIKRRSGKCPECHTVLPDLDPNAPLKWLPPNSELQSLASVLST